MSAGSEERGAGDRPEIDLATRLARLDAFEAELVRKGAPLLGSVNALSHADFFVVGAARRTLAQARGFKQLIEARNFPCAAAILRMQIDTAMRINALFLVEDMSAACRSVLDGARFNTLRDRSGAKLSDAHLRAKLAEEHPWINPVYERASDFVHLSGRHFYTSIASTDDTTRIATFTISGEDPAAARRDLFRGGRRLPAGIDVGRNDDPGLSRHPCGPVSDRRRDRRGSRRGYGASRSMIHDLFLRRYPNQIYWGDRPTPAMHRLFTQVAHIVFSDLAPALKLDQSFFKAVHDALARELGLGRLVDAPTYDAICGEYLTESYDLWKDRHGTADTFLKARLSLVELLFRAMEERVSSRRAAAAPRPTLLSRSPSPAPTNDGRDEAVSAAVRELNNRLRQAGMGLHYHNGLIQFAQDELTQERAAEPCWTILRDVKWANVDRELKEAIDHADGGRPDAAFHAAKALESTIKIISDDQGWTSGKERGAANYIDNLVSQKNGRFLEPWEGEMLKAFFVHARNPHGHGAGSQPPPALTDPQTTWAIETTMSWIKSLVRRL